MKAAMWGVGLFVLGLLGLVLINLFGNITVTNQFNYTTMKNAVQAAMLDSLDIAHYRAGFCLCTTDGSAINTETLRSFSDKNQYQFRDIVNDKCVNADNEIMNNCITLYGEYRLNVEKFEKTFGERFANVKTNNKEYEYIIKEIIEYPPKVSVMVISKDEEFFSTDKEAGGYNIVNQIDAIVETNGKVTVNYQQPVQPTVETHTITIHHYLEGTTTKVHADTKMTKNKGDTYTTKYFTTAELDSKYKNEYVWNGTTPKNAKGTVGSSDIAVTYYYKVNPNKKYTITVHHYLEKTTTKVHADTTISKKKGEKYTTSYYTPGALEGKYKSKYIWNKVTPKNASGTMGTSNITVIYYYKAKASSTTCKWHYYLTCYNSYDPAKRDWSVLIKVKASGLNSSPNTSAAKSACEAESKSYCATFTMHLCEAVRDYRCTINGVTKTLRNREIVPGDNCVCLG